MRLWMVMVIILSGFNEAHDLVEEVLKLASALRRVAWRSPTRERQRGYWE
jgi:hypothetical protein